MNLRFFYQGVDIDERTQEYILKRLERIEKLVDPVSEFEVEIDMDKKGKFRVEIMVKTPHDLFRSEETSESIEGSTDIAIDEMEIQIGKKRTRSHDLKIRGSRSIKKNTVLDDSARF